jgi:hypothetical protein
MAEEIDLRTTEEAKNLLRKHLVGIDVTIEKVFEEGDSWGYFVNFGNFPVIIESPEGSHYCIVSFQIMLPDDYAVEYLNAFYERNDFKFLFDLTKAFTSPLTAFSRVLNKEGKVIGYRVAKYIYPYHPEFSIRTLDIALQAVVSMGVVGAAFLRSMMGEIHIQHALAEEFARTTPGPMFG